MTDVTAQNKGRLKNQDIDRYVQPIWPDLCNKGEGWGEGGGLMAITTMLRSFQKKKN